MRNNDLLDQKIRGNFLYQVFPDYDGRNYIDDIDFESEAEKAEYLKRYFNDEFSFYHCVKSEKCKCCEQWKTIDSLSGIEADCADSALDHYIQDYHE